MSAAIRPNYYRATVRAHVPSGGNQMLEVPGVRVECFDLIDALELDFYTGNALKYLWRAGKKSGESRATDLKKIRTYIDQAIEREQS